MKGDRRTQPHRAASKRPQTLALQAMQRGKPAGTLRRPVNPKRKRRKASDGYKSPLHRILGIRRKVGVR